MNIEQANRTCLENIQMPTAHWTDIRPAREVVPGMDDYTVFHAGPPVAWENMCGPMRGSIIGACIFEGWADSPEAVEKIVAAGTLRFDSSHHHRAIGPMSGIITPSMEVSVVRNDAFGLETYATLYMGIGKVLRHGAYDAEVMEKLRWMNQELAPLLKKTLAEAGGIDLKSIVAQALQMGAELHNRNRASNALLVNSRVTHMNKVGEPASG